MSPGKKTVLGILSFLPVILFGIYFYYYIRWVMEFIPGAASYGNDPSLMFQDMQGLFGLMLKVMLPAGAITLGLMIYYIIQIINSKTLPEAERIIWIVLVVLLNAIAFPVYWVMRIRPLPSQPIQQNL
jgi:hypothetical protein